MSEKPDGALTGVLWEFTRQVNAVEKHTACEGHCIPTRTVLESYDRTLHPWLHGRRPGELIAKLRGWWFQ